MSMRTTPIHQVIYTAALLTCSQAIGAVIDIKITGISNEVNIMFPGAKFDIPAANTTDQTIWRGSYEETSLGFKLVMHSGTEVDFNNFDNDLDHYTLDLKGLWTIGLDVGIRDNALFSDEDVFSFSGSLQHTAGRGVPHPLDEPGPTDAEKGTALPIGFAAVNVADDDTAQKVVAIGAQGPPLLGGFQGSFWQYHIAMPVLHDVEGDALDHSDSYEVYFLADVNTTANSMSGYHIFISGQHNGFPPPTVPDTSSLICDMLVVIGILSPRLRRWLVRR
jgi:hypothetical protein